jgi:2-polyprenyl-3-methyl-5-hydroxy-6-metoxy-1,4-benzoquinol methylase
MTSRRSLESSNGYEELAGEFMSRRSPSIGSATVREWAKTLIPGASILDVGCGPGVPISLALIEEGCAVYGVDASPTLIAAFRERFPRAAAVCESVEDSEFFGRSFDGVVSWGLMFLLTPEVQSLLIRKVSRALNPGGTFLFTSPKDVCEWRDSLTGRASISLGADAYQRILAAEGLVLIGEQSDEGDNHYYCASKLP